MFDTDKFIECVHGIPALWDKSAAEYSDKIIRDRAWIEIGIVMYEDWNCATLRERDDRGKSLYFLVKGGLVASGLGSPSEPAPLQQPNKTVTHINFKLI